MRRLAIIHDPISFLITLHKNTKTSDKRATRKSNALFISPFYHFFVIIVFFSFRLKSVFSLLPDLKWCSSKPHEKLPKIKTIPFPSDQSVWVCESRSCVLVCKSDKSTGEMRRRKRTNIFQLCALCISTITIINLISECSAGSTILLEDRMEVVRRVLKEVPLIDG